MLTVHHLTVGAVRENTYAVVDEQKNALIIDPGAQAKRLIHWIETNEWRPQAILLTHAHYDHIGAVDAVRERFGVEVYAHPIEAEIMTKPELNLSSYTPERLEVAMAEHQFQEMGEQQVGDFHFRVVFVPGHSPGHVAYIFDEDQFVINGDTIMEGTIGRTDLYKGSYVQLMQSIGRELVPLPAEYRLYPGHGNDFTIGEAIATNPYFEVFRQMIKHRLD